MAVRLSELLEPGGNDPWGRGVACCTWKESSTSSQATQQEPASTWVQTSRLTCFCGHSTRACQHMGANTRASVYTAA
eukprot:1161544-Pelagomonas_calceolata.AAC.7